MGVHLQLPTDLGLQRGGNWNVRSEELMEDLKWGFHLIDGFKGVVNVVAGLVDPPVPCLREI